MILPRDPANVNEWKIIFDPYSGEKNVQCTGQLSLGGLPARSSMVRVNDCLSMALAFAYCFECLTKAPSQHD